MHQWSTGRYERKPVTPEDINSYHERYTDGEKSCTMTMCDGNEIVGYISMRIPAGDPSERRIGFDIVDDSKRGTGLGRTLQHYLDSIIKL